MRKSAQTVIRPDAYYTIAAANGRVLEVADFNTENGASVRLWSYEGSALAAVAVCGSGGRRVPHQEPLYGQGHGLGHVRRLQRHLVHQWTQTAGAGQRWQIVEAGGGKVKLRNVLADKVIDWWECAWRTAPRPRSGRMSLARTSSGSSTLCPSAC